jgi:SagB-type dehydrogenase family enzyme
MRRYTDSTLAERFSSARSGAGPEPQQPTPGRSARRAPEELRTVALPAGEHDLARTPREAAPQHQAFSSDPILARELAGMLGMLRCWNVNGQPKYHYASAGGLYPVQTYVHVRPTAAGGGVEGLDGGGYYFHAVENALYPTASTDLGARDRNIAEHAPVTICLVADLDAIVPMYGREALRMSCLEAGMMARLLEEKATTHGLGVCHFDRIDLDVCAAAFALSDAHVLLDTLVAGRAAGAVDEAA